MLYNRESFFPPKVARCQVTEHCCHPSLNAQHAYKDYSLLLAAPDISRIYISSRTIHLWTVQVTNMEYIVLRATFGRQRLTFDALHAVSLLHLVVVAMKILKSYNYNLTRDILQISVCM